MYTKVFRSIYDGTLADNWQAMVTFQQMLILADSQGVVDMTPSAMARITGIPLEILLAGIAVLEAPDAGSRTPEMEGRRIARLDAHRDWGWFLVNFAKYRAMQTREEKKEADRERIREKRAAERSGMSQGVAGCSNVSRAVASVADVAHTDTDTDLRSKDDSLTGIVSTPAVVEPDPPDPGDDEPEEDLPGVVPAARRKRETPTCPGQKIADLWDAILLPEAASISQWNDRRARVVGARWKEQAEVEGWKTQEEGLAWFETIFKACRESKFLMGKVAPRQGHLQFKLKFDWFFGAENFIRIIEGDFHRGR